MAQNLLWEQGTLPVPREPPHEAEDRVPALGPKTGGAEGREGKRLSAQHLGLGRETDPARRRVVVDGGADTSAHGAVDDLALPHGERPPPPLPLPTFPWAGRFASQHGRRGPALYA